MNYPKRSEIGRRINLLLGSFAVSFLVVLLLFLTSCTICPDETCPMFPNAAPRQ